MRNADSQRHNNRLPLVWPFRYCCHVRHSGQGVDLLEGLEGVDVEVQILDLGSLQSVVAFAERFTDSGAKVDVLINNAGVMATPERLETVDGLEMQIRVNHFGGHLLTRLMEPMIADGGRVVFSASLGHDQPPGVPKTTMDWDNINYEGGPGTYDSWMAYGRSKLASVLDAKEFAKRLAGRGINTYAVHPGIVDIEPTRNNADDSCTSRVKRLAFPVLKYVLSTPLTGALTSLRCAVDPALATLEFSGKYWADTKETLPSKLAMDHTNPPRLWVLTEDVLEAKLGKKLDSVLASKARVTSASAASEETGGSSLGELRTSPETELL